MCHIPLFAGQAVFDPDTAQARVRLSRDNTEMSTWPNFQSVTDLPGRYDVALAALGKTGYSSGRNYWEVYVASNLCYLIGMASESAPRKGTIIFAPSKGYWTIVRNKQGQLAALGRPPFNIEVQTPPSTLGILLDYKQGKISFYDAGTKSHLYTFVGQVFTEKIYPFVNFCVEDDHSQMPVVLLSPGPIDWID